MVGFLSNHLQINIISISVRSSRRALINFTLGSSRWTPITPRLQWIVLRYWESSHIDVDRAAIGEKSRREISSIFKSKFSIIIDKINFSDGFLCFRRIIFIYTFWGLKLFVLVLWARLSNFQLISSSYTRSMLHDVYFSLPNFPEFHNSLKSFGATRKINATKARRNLNLLFDVW